jgi:hypothetical protein
MFCSFKPRLPVEMGSSAATHPVTLNLVTLLWWASVLSCGPLLWTSPPHQEELRRCHVSHGTISRFPTEEGSGAATRPAVSYGPWGSSIKKDIADLAMQLDSCVPKAWSRVSKMSAPEQL